MLDKIRQTATGLDLLPAWFIRTAAPFLSLPLAHLFNLSISQSRVPTQWKVNSITPVHKITKSQTCQDYRPISITPVLSRVLEKSIVPSFLYPVLLDPVFSKTISDRFAFRPTGSTTAALITLLQHLTDLVTQYGYVHLIALDFSKAFDTLRSDNVILHTLAGCSRDSVVALLDKYSQCFFWIQKGGGMSAAGARRAPQAHCIERRRRETRRRGG